uniref:CCT domain-containing protein n=1 Tax=Fabrea salina TaxID=342563 RepID=A0A7S3I8R9_9CILI|mmetsp:Transcript_1269/g.2019  ORF Transcript_1269/g.2019 Transcript_1269/m.2019 type:complete len:177 (+) Transcript_1269:34-564(+)
MFDPNSFANLFSGGGHSGDLPEADQRFLLPPSIPECYFSFPSLENLPLGFGCGDPLPFFEPSFMPVEDLGSFAPSVKAETSSLPKPLIPFPGNKRIGTITLEERKLKIQRFLKKRQKRNFEKKVSYACRKRVADNRIRVKGRFVTKVQAEALKGLENEKNNVKVPSTSAKTAQSNC